MDIVKAIKEEGCYCSSCSNLGSEVRELEQRLAAAQARIAELREALEHYAEQDIRNARHYPPEFAKDALASTDNLFTLEEAKQQAKREALMEAADHFAYGTSFELRRMAGEVK